MILRNMELWAKANICQTDNNSTAQLPLPETIKDINGNTYINLFKQSNAMGPYTLGFIYTGGGYTNSGGSGQTTLWIGTGTNDVSSSDYSLNPVSDSDMSRFSDFTVDRKFDSGKTYLKFSRSFRFSDSLANSITITEIGLVKQVPVASNDMKQFLIVREKLPTPVVVNAGDTKTFEIVVEM